MLGMAALSHDQFDAIHDLIHDTYVEVDGLIITNPGPQQVRAVLVVNDEPQTGESRYDKTFDFDGRLLHAGSPLAAHADALQMAFWVIVGIYALIVGMLLILFPGDH